jgi:hypothetical protein
MKLSTRVVYWKIEIDGFDITSVIGPYVSDIKVRSSILPLPKIKTAQAKPRLAFQNFKSTSERAPSEADISVTSHDYIEVIFTEGRKIKIYMGYDPIRPPLVFSGIIVHLPDGSARDMLNYTVKALSTEIMLALEQKNRAFTSLTKTGIIQEIAIAHSLIAIVDIEGDNIIQGKYQMLQRAKTDLEFLTNCAEAWKCKMWFAHPDILYFISDTGDKVHTYQQKSTVYLGYRTDIMDCNVESVSWKHEPPRAALELNSGIGGFNEQGTVKGIDEFKIHALDIETNRWATFKLKSNVANLIKDKKLGMEASGSLFKILAQGMFSSDNYQTFRKYWKIVDYDDKNSPDSPPSSSDSGWGITVNMNEADPTLFPPFRAVLYSGSMDPHADTSHLPIWLTSWGGEKIGATLLNINEVYLNYTKGVLTNEFRCSVSLNLR